MYKDHIQLNVAEMPKNVLLPGDPQRVDEIGRYLTSVELRGDNREYRTITGNAGGVPIGVCSTGMGGPSTEIAVVELFQKKVKRFLRIGTAGALQSNVRAGDLIIISGCIRESGAARSYVSDNYPAFADYRMVAALVQACEELEYPYHVGLGVSVDCFYATKPDAFGKRSIPSQIVSSLAEYIKGGALCLEMEAATMMVLAQILGVQSAAICTAGINLITKEKPAAPLTNKAAIEVALRSVEIMENGALRF